MPIGLQLLSTGRSDGPQPQHFLWLAVGRESGQPVHSAWHGSTPRVSVGGAASMHSVRPPGQVCREGQQLTMLSCLRLPRASCLQAWSCLWTGCRAWPSLCLAWAQRRWVLAHGGAGWRCMHAGACGGGLHTCSNAHAPALQPALQPPLPPSLSPCLPRAAVAVAVVVMRRWCSRCWAWRVWPCGRLACRVPGPSSWEGRWP